MGAGATILEKRLTLSRDKPLNGHWKAHEPEEFKIWLDRAKECFVGLGEPNLRATKDDLKSSKVFYKSARLKKNVEKGGKNN